jgi:hypothetical protein
MDLSTMIGDLKAHFQNAETEAEKFLGEHLPALASLADKAAANPAVDAIMAAEHLSPDWFTSIADVINKADAALGVAVDARAAAEASAAAATQAAGVPAEPDPAAVPPA